MIGHVSVDMQADMKESMEDMAILGDGARAGDDCSQHVLQKEGRA